MSHQELFEGIPPMMRNAAPGGVPRTVSAAMMP